jgi:ABC-type sugar transport system ATPase subunit
VLGITGLVGAGKTETLCALIGIDKVSPFEMTVKGAKFKPKGPRSALDRGICIVPEDRKLQGLVLVRSVCENVSMNKTYRKKITKLGLLKKKEEAKDVAGMIEKLAIKVSGPQQQIKYLSGGNQQKCVIAKSLLAEPFILMLDEPTRGIDIGARTMIYNLIRDLSKKGLGILLCSSDISEISMACDRVLVLSDKEIAGELVGEEINISSILNYAAGGTNSEKN